MNEEKQVIKADGVQRLDVFLAEKTQISRSYIKQLIDDGYVKLNGKSVKGGKKTAIDDVIEITFPFKDSEIKAQDIPLDIIYEDEAIAVINKQAGISVHPAPHQNDNTLVNALMFCLKNLSAINGVQRPGIVHRLDKDTTGVIVVAKTDEAHLSLSRQIAQRKVKKIYRGLVEGVVKENKGQIATLIGRDSKERKKMTVTGSMPSSPAANVFSGAKGREAITYFKVIERFEQFTYVEFDIITGRTHQIRVHAKHIGHPIVGDKAYGLKKQRLDLEHQLLHAYSLTFNHPVTKKTMTFTAPLPQIFQDTLNGLR